jgi:transposase IS116/IS110/IS902 family protein
MQSSANSDHSPCSSKTKLFGIEFSDLHVSKEDSIKPWCDQLESQLFEAEDFADEDPVFVPADVAAIIHPSQKETQALLKVHGVGHLTALTFVLTLGSKERFGRSRDVGCYLGLRPRRSQSGDHDPQLGITHAGNAYLRSLLIECSNHILRPHGRDSALRQWGLRLAARGGKQAKSKAVVAVARKLAVLLHRLWSTQGPYMPFYEQAA